MKTTLVSKENNTAKLTMEFTAEEFDAAVNQVYRKNRNRFAINGFRKGKAPRSIIEKHYGEGVFFEDAINNMYAENYGKALDELDLEVIDQAAVDFDEIGKGKPLVMTCTVSLFPIVEVKDYQGVEVEQVEREVTDEEVGHEIESMQKRNARMVVVDRPVEDGDTVLLDYAGFVGDEQFEGGTAERQELKIGSGSFIPGFEEQLIGAVSGEQRDVNVTFPEDYHAENLAGKEAVFHCTVHEVKAEELPELDDEFAMDVSEFDTLDELKADIKSKQQKTADEQYLNDAKDKVVEKVYEENKPEVPASMVNAEIDQIAQEMDQQLQYQGLSLQQYCQFTGKTLEQFREDIREDAEKRVGTRIVLRSIADAEKIEATEEDVEKELASMAEMYKLEVEKLKDIMGDSLSFLKKDIVVKKVIDKLYDMASVTKVAPKDPEAKIEEVTPEEAPAEEAPAEE
ncbi:MAG: trigger factor [Eubacterium sp.]|nr:trigger factor [Eubacterium sp.]